MAKGVGLIGNFKGKVGNTVGYSLKDSNNKQTQGIRVYQPVVRNPKTYAQAEQRAKLAPINATYRALKIIIDRGQQGLAYGNKSRLAWLSDAIKAFNGAWFVKSAAVNMPALVPLTKGSLASLPQPGAGDDNVFLAGAYDVATTPTTIGALSTALLGKFPILKAGDQITFVTCSNGDSSNTCAIESIVIDTTSTDAIPSTLELSEGDLVFNPGFVSECAGAIILSREGENGAHLRSTVSLTRLVGYDTTKMADAAKEAAIVSYMSQGANTDWAEESLMQ